MRPTSALLLLVLITGPVSSFAEDKKEDRTLAADAAVLADKSGKGGWTSDVVTVTREASKARGKLQMRFTADKDKSGGSLTLSIDHGTSAVAGVGNRFELTEKDGKRSLKILQAGEAPPKGDPKAVPKVVATLEYTLKGDELTLQGGVVSPWAGWDVDLTKPVVFKAAAK